MKIVLFAGLILLSAVSCTFMETKVSFRLEIKII